MKKIILCLTSLVFGVILSTSFFLLKDNAQTIEQCPVGSYEIDRDGDKPICKAEPTGCPYGENIPLDSPKCAPPSPEAYTPWNPTPEPETKPTTKLEKECK